MKTGFKFEIIIKILIEFFQVRKPLLETYVRGVIGYKRNYDQDSKNSIGSNNSL